eukprot:SAG31_NODE_2301_length_5978_cov_14.073652_3_plen_707_part_00
MLLVLALLLLLVAPPYRILECLAASSTATTRSSPAAATQLVLEHGSALVGRGYTTGSASAGLPVLAAKGESESAQLVIMASEMLREVTVIAEHDVAPGIKLRVTPIGFVRLGPCPFDVEPATYNQTCPKHAPWWCPTGVAATRYSTAPTAPGCAAEAGHCRGCSAMGPQTCAAEGFKVGESGPAEPHAMGFCPNAVSGSCEEGCPPTGHATYSRPNDTMYTPQNKYQPHVLLPNISTFSVAPNMAQPVLLTFDVSRTATAGNYSADIAVNYIAGSLSTTVHLIVFDFELPAAWHFPTLWGVWPGGSKALYTDTAKTKQQHDTVNITALELELVELLLSHRIPVTSLYGHSPTKGAAGDWPAVLGQGVDGLRKLWARGQRTYNLMCVDQGMYPGRQPNVTTTAGLIKTILAARNLSDAAGWPRNLTTVYMFDEPSSYQEMVLLQNVSKEISRAIGNQTRIVTLGNQAAILASAQISFAKTDWSGIGAFCPNMEVFAAIDGDHDTSATAITAAEGTAFRLQRAQGKQIWWYSSAMMMGNYSTGWNLGVPPIRSRLKMGHTSWKYGVEGFIYYEFFAWESYCERPWSNCSVTGHTPTLDVTGYMNDRQSFDGEGQLAVPGPHGALGTLFLENIRDGFEDFELYWLLQRLRDDQHVEVPTEVAGALPHCLRANENCVPSEPVSTDDPLVLHNQRLALATQIMRALHRSGK